MPQDGFVLDCSVTLCWYFRDEVNDYAEQVQDQLAHVRAIVPVIWPLEVANALLMGERRKRSTEAQSTAWIQHLTTMPIEVETLVTAQAWGEVLAILGTTRGRCPNWHGSWNDRAECARRLRSCSHLTGRDTC
jgi:hypothetical protein